MAKAPQYQFYLPHVEATEQFGRALAPFLQVEDFIALWGDLGAGKTALARAIIRARQAAAGCDMDAVQSPTFTLAQTYEAGDVLITHYDFYRIESESEMIELGFEDALDQGMVLAEWPERMGERIYPDRLDIRLSISGEGRQVGLSGQGSWTPRLEHMIATGCCRELENVE